MAESIEQKALALIAEGRVRVTFLTENEVMAKVQGGHEYTVFKGQEKWRCNCQATGDCKHLTAVKLIRQALDAVARSRAADPPKKTEGEELFGR